MQISSTSQMVKGQHLFIKVHSFNPLSNERKSMLKSGDSHAV